MKKLLALLMVIGFLFGAPAMTTADDFMGDLATGTEEFGSNFFTILHDVVKFPVDMTEKAIRTLLMMDHTDTSTD